MGRYSGTCSSCGAVDPWVSPAGRCNTCGDPFTTRETPVSPGGISHRPDTRQELPARRESLVYTDPRSRSLNHVLDLFGTVHGAISEDNEQALWSLREILHLYGDYHRRALAAERRLKEIDNLAERHALREEARQEALLDGGSILADHLRLKGEL